MSTVSVRRARPDEAAVLVEMANDLNDHVGIQGRPFTLERMHDAGFGPQAAFTPLVAELEGVVVGYVFVSPAYSTDVAARSMTLHDLFVAPAARGRGVGYALMAAAAAETVREGCALLEWGVHTTNAGALEFYRRLGAIDANVRIMTLDGESLRALASAAPQPVRQGPAQQVLERSYKGLMAKDPASPQLGGRTLKWLKVKQAKYREGERGWEPS